MSTRPDTHPPMPLLLAAALTLRFLLEIALLAGAALASWLAFTGF